MSQSTRSVASRSRIAAWHQSASISRTLAGHFAISVPCVWNIATARRSIPKATHAGMSRFTRCVDDVPRRAEMITMIVEAHAGGRLRFGTQRDQKFEFQRLLDLADCHHLADTSEKRIAGRFDLERETEIARDGLRAHPSSVRESPTRRPGCQCTHIRASGMTEACRDAGWLAAKAVGRNVKTQAALGAAGLASLQSDRLDNRPPEKARGLQQRAMSSSLHRHRSG